MYPADLGVMFGLLIEVSQGAGWTYIGTNGAVVVAKLIFKIQHGLHHSTNTVFEESRFDNLCRTFTYTQMAGCTLS
ncbi:hypothetical protein SDC9_45025 [bioreactor metagenome]|uniref:Uncharacterized protein n=1 Tax=bioreactor metagenome TaxID=1076179 RepID=A0A644W4X7_9ZZZZ